MGSRDRLTEAMGELLWERGYAATSPRDVLARAGVGQGSMYHHFTGKHQLAVDTLSTVSAQLVNESVLLGDDGTALERMKAHLGKPRPGTLGCRIGRMTQDPQVVQDAELIAIVAGAFERILDQWRATISAAITEGDLAPSVAPNDLAHTMVAVIQGGYVLARAQGDQAPMDAAIRGALALLDAARTVAITSAER